MSACGRIAWQYAGIASAAWGNARSGSLFAETPVAGDAKEGSILEGCGAGNRSISPILLFAMTAALTGSFTGRPSTVADVIFSAASQADSVAFLARACWALAQITRMLRHGVICIVAISSRSYIQPTPRAPKGMRSLGLQPRTRP